MCTGTEVALLLASTAGTVMTQQANEDANNQRQSILNAAQEETSNLNEKKAATVENFAQGQMGAQMRAQRYEDSAKKQEGTLTQALLDANGGEGEVKTQGEGKVSSDFVRAKADATANSAQDIMNRAKSTSRLNAGGLMYGQEAIGGANLASDVAGLTSRMNRTNRYAQTSLSGVNNNGSLVGGLLTGAAGSYRPSSTTT